MSEKENTFVVLGGTGSVGTALVQLLTDCGARVAVGTRDTEKATTLATRLGCDIYTVTADDAASIERCVKSTKDRYGGITGVANCIGSVLLKPAHLTTDKEWQDTITTNLSSSFSVVRAAAEAMRQSGGSVVLVSSAAAQIGLANPGF